MSAPAARKRTAGKHAGTARKPGGKPAATKAKPAKAKAPKKAPKKAPTARPAAGKAGQGKPGKASPSEAARQPAPHPGPLPADAAGRGGAPGAAGHAGGEVLRLPADAAERAGAPAAAGDAGGEVPPLPQAPPGGEGRGEGAAEGTGLRAAPASDAIPFGELSRDAGSAFLYAALLPEETLTFVRQLGLTRPGFRPESMGEVERCDLLADELAAHPPAREPVMAALRTALKEPAFARATLDEAAADELLDVAGTDHGLAIALWRLLVDPAPEVRRRGVAALERLAAEWYGPPPEGAEAAPGAAPGRGGGGGAPGGDEGARRSKALEEKLSKAEARAEEARLRADAQREKLQAQVKEARAEAARAVEEAARAREAAGEARAAQRQAEGALAAARASDAAAEAARLRGALRDAEVRLHAAEAGLARAGERVAALEAALRAAEAGPAAPAGEAAAPGAPAEAGEPEEAPAAWLLPVFTPEFYESLQGWDRRIQRAALKQAFLLSQDWRHPSLRALALEGLPGYYRVRVATDVRLIYRRGERQDAVEICSLIDREDLDRYVRQAKTR